MTKIILFLTITLFSVNSFAQTIVSLAPHITELLFAIGAGKQVVAVSQHSDYPPEANKLPIVADYRSLDIEKILTINDGAPADLIIAWQEGTPQHLILQLQQLKLEVYSLSIDNIASIADAMLTLGELTGNNSQAEIQAVKFLERYQKLEKKFSKNKTFYYFYPLNKNPLMTFNADNTLATALSICGGINIFADSLVSYPQVSIEAIIERNPDVILIADDAGMDVWQDYWQQWTMITAVKNQHIYTIPSVLLHRFGPRILEGIEHVCEKIR